MVHDVSEVVAPDARYVLKLYRARHWGGRKPLRDRTFGAASAGGAARSATTTTCRRHRRDNISTRRLPEFDEALPSAEENLLPDLATAVRNHLTQYSGMPSRGTVSIG
jgi:hypothetical protein